MLILFSNWGKRYGRMQIKCSGSQCEDEDILICFISVSAGNYLIITKRIKSKGVKRPGKILTSGQFMEIISLILHNFMPSNTCFEVRLENSCTITGQDCHHRRAQSSHQSGKQVKPRAWEFGSLLLGLGANPSNSTWGFFTQFLLMLAASFKLAPQSSEKSLSLRALGLVWISQVSNYLNTSDSPFV